MVSSKWQKTKLIGHGGTVYEAVTVAQHRSFPLPIAIKSAPLVMSETLQKEEDILRKRVILVPGIIKCHGSEIVHDDKGFQVYNLLLELAPHGSLTNLTKKQQFLEETHEATKAYISMILRGLAFLHAKGIFHCDIKPDNISVFPPGSIQHSSYYQLKLADFGLAITPEERAKGDLLICRGTPRYMSPECKESVEIETASDIWSFGRVVLEMISALPTET